MFSCHCWNIILEHDCHGCHSIESHGKIYDWFSHLSYQNGSWNQFRNEIIVLSDLGGFNSSTLTTLMQSQEICGLQHNLMNKQYLQIILVGETVVRLLFTYEVLWLLLINIWLSYYSQCKLVECSTDYMTFAIIFVDTCNFGLSVC